MIRVTRAEAPADFNERVRAPGLAAIAELVGEPPKKKHPGRTRKKVADDRADLSGEDFPPFWRKVLPEMLESYHRLCAYLALYIEHATGSPTVDHVIPKSKAWDKVYEWSNYRLASGFVNGKKNSVEYVLDPFELEGELFALELVGFQVVPSDQAVGELETRVSDTIETLGLSLPEACKARLEYFESYQQREISLRYLERRAPFIARELRRQNRLHPEDA